MGEIVQDTILPFVSSLHLLKGGPHTFTHVPTSMWTVSHYRASDLSGICQWAVRWTRHGGMQLTIWWNCRCLTQTRSQSLIPLSCALSLGLCILFPCIHTGWAVRLKTPQHWYYRSPRCLLRTCRSLINTLWALWEMFCFSFYLVVIPALAVTFPIILSRWGAKDLKILKTTW